MHDIAAAYREPQPIENPTTTLRILVPSTSGSGPGQWMQKRIVGLWFPQRGTAVRAGSKMHRVESVTWDVFREDVQIRMKPRDLAWTTAVDLEIDLLREGWLHVIE